MSQSMNSTDVGLLRQLQTAAEPGGQLPKHVAQELERQGLVRVGDRSPGEVSLSDAGRQRLQQLVREHDGSDDIVP